MHFSWPPLTVLLLLIESISSVAALPSPSKNQPLGKAKRSAIEDVTDDSPPDYPWIADLPAIKAGAIQDREYEMEDHEFDDFLALSGFKLGADIIEVDVDDQDPSQLGQSGKLVPRKVKWCHNTVFKYLVVTTFRYKCGKYPKRKDCLPTVIGWNKNDREVITYYPCGEEPPFHEPYHPERLFHFGDPGR